MRLKQFDAPVLPPVVTPKPLNAWEPPLYRKCSDIKVSLVDHLYFVGSLRIFSRYVYQSLA